MGGEGHVFDMINRTKQNRALRPKNKLRDIYHSKKDNESGIRKLKFKSISSEKLNKIKLDILRSSKKENRRKIITAFLSIIITVVILYLFYKLVTTDAETIDKALKNLFK